MADDLSFSNRDAQKLSPYLPPISTPDTVGSSDKSPTAPRPFVTLTFATSLDSSLALAPGTRTRLSGPESKAMTHYLRSKHDAICIGVGTAVADDPALNCRLLSGPQPRPIVIDPQARWNLEGQSKVLQVAREGKGKGPIILTGVTTPPSSYSKSIEQVGGKFITIKLNENGRFEWLDILSTLYEEGIRSIMIEGGASVINSLLESVNHSLVDSVIVTIAPTWLGQGGVVVSPRRVIDGGVTIPAARLVDVSWNPLGEDVVLCGRLR
ncbi:hypothetical protein jhhlp_003641 [Lomentospora prolificans]|uniref:2,5-diamino-6-ribosylamino-4(3H)-pyrimidinone 5'-phosphate reductase n=1 Tax=Lomentospora prolificans TaxID=41688 RepID=A0A2N3N9A6_9PEZI|nr:hypothetical protein jhhlp_003641 [Lomentospora prolificans]